jgi:hypothetical protein
LLNGIEVVSADGESRPPDIVLSDVLIRRMSGSSWELRSPGISRHSDLSVLRTGRDQ